MAKGVGGEGRGEEVEQGSTGVERGRGAAKGAIRWGGILHCLGHATIQWGREALDDKATWRGGRGEGALQREEVGLQFG